ncbi:MAG: hypothetical protein R3E97_15180 [Candidatus Eisenbacteria bacterium]
MSSSRTLALFLTPLSILAGAVTPNFAGAACDSQDHLHWVGRPVQLSGPSFEVTYIVMTEDLAFISGTGHFPDYPNNSAIIDISDPNNLVQVGTIPAPSGWRASNYTVEGDRFYVVASEEDGPGAALSVYDIGSGTPALLGQTPLANAFRVEAEGDLLFSSEGGLTILDPTDPTNLVVLGNVSIDNRGMLAVGDLIYVATPTGFTVFDVSSPASPTAVGTWAGAAVDDWCLDGDHLYVVNGSGLEIVDVTNPGSPVTVGTYAQAAVISVAANAGRIYLGASDLILLDGSDPTAPSYVGTLDVNTTQWDLASNAEFLGVAGGFQLYAHQDVAPAAAIGSLDTGRALDLTVQNGVAYVLDDTNGFLTVDVTNSATPVLLSSDIPGRFDLIEIVGSYAYLDDWVNDALITVEISNPAAPLVVSTLPGLVGARDLRVAGDYIFATTSSSLIVISRVNPVAPSLVTSVSTNLFQTYGLEVQGDYAYVGGLLGVGVFDVSDPEAPLPVGGDFLELGRGFTEADGYLYAIGRFDPDFQSGPAGEFLYVYSLASPDAPVAIATLPIPQGPNSVPRLQVENGLLSYAAGFHGAIFIDVSDPATPTVVGQLPLDGSCYGIASSEGSAYLANRDDGLVIGQMPCPATTAVEPDGGSGIVAAMLHLSPNPTSGRTMIALRNAGDRGRGVEVFDPSGRLVRRLAWEDSRGDAAHVVWDGRDDAGRAVSPGVYFVRTTGESEAAGKVQILR